MTRRHPTRCGTRAIGAAGAQVLYTHKVSGSNPLSPTKSKRVASQSLRPFLVIPLREDPFYLQPRAPSACRKGAPARYAFASGVGAVYARAAYSRSRS